MVIMIKGIIITSGKFDFSGGMDLSTLEALKRNSGSNPASKIFEYIMEVADLLCKNIYSSILQIDMIQNDPEIKEKIVKLAEHAQKNIDQGKEEVKKIIANEFKNSKPK